MSNVINQNLDEIISIKNQLSNVLIENGVEAGNRFSDYPDMFRSVIASGGSFNPSYYYTIDEIDENFVSYSYLAAALEDIDMSDYLPLTGGEVTGPLYVSYQQSNNALYGFKSYSHIVAGDENKTTPAFLASKRYCANGIGSYINMASFFVNGDGRAKFAHKSSAGGGGDDAFMCFNAYGFKVSYSGAAGVSASTEYDLIHSGNIGQYAPVTDENIIPKETNTYTLGDSSYIYNATYSGKYKFAYNTYLNSTSDYGVTLAVNNNENYQWNLYQFSMINNNYRSQCSLGTSSAPWAYTYTNNLYLNGTNIMDIIGDVETLLANI